MKVKQISQVMKKVSIETVNFFNEVITLTGFIFPEDEKKDSVRLFEEEGDEDFFIINKKQISKIF